MAKLLAFLLKHGISQSELAARVGMRQVTLWRKIDGQRPFRLPEIHAVLAEARKLEPDITFEDLFGEETRVAA